MEIVGWICGGLLGFVLLLAVLFYLFVMLPYDREQKRLANDGTTVVGKVFLANPSVYEEGDAPNFEFAFVLFTRENDPSSRHLAYLQSVIDKLEDFEADESDADEKKLAWSLETQRTIGDVIRVPDRLTGGREVYFSTPGITRKMLPEGKLTRDYIHVRVIFEGKYRASAMTDYPKEITPDFDEVLTEID